MATHASASIAVGASPSRKPLPGLVACSSSHPWPVGSVVKQDWLLDRIDAVEQAAEAVRDALSHTDEVLAPAREQLKAGAPLIAIAQDLVSRGAEPRRFVSASLRA